MPRTSPSFALRALETNQTSRILNSICWLAEMFGGRGPGDFVRLLLFCLRSGILGPSMRVLFAACLGALLLAGCEASHELMPLEIGHSWSYQVQAGFQNYMGSTKVVRRIAVGGVQGYELHGPFGDARVAWIGDQLVADRLGANRFVPPVPLLSLAKKESIPWQGTIFNLEGATDSTATLTQTAATIPVGAQSFKTTCTTLTIKAGSHAIELVTWFAPSIGIVKQEQRTDGVRSVALEWLGEG